MRTILLIPLKLVHYLIRVQEIKSYNVFIFLAFCVFTGIARGLEEILLFGISLKSSEVIIFIHFYFSLAIILTAGISMIAHLPWQKVNNVILVGVFLGLFPPLIDSFLPRQTQVFYGFYFVHNWYEIPWFGYKPEFNFPLGECITIWLSVFFSGYYVFYRSHSLPLALATSFYAYCGFMVFGSLLPMLVTYLVAGYVPDIQSARSLDESLLRSIVYYNAFAQTALASLVYLLLRGSLLRYLVRRSLHPLPFVAIALLGAAIAGKLTGHAILASLLIFWGGWMNLLQNNLYDMEDDRRENFEQITEHDINFFNIAFLLATIALFFTGNRMVLPVLLMYPLTFLYNHPSYRGKKKFPTNLKIEGAWGLGAFLTGALAGLQPLPEKFPLLCALVFGGFSLIAALKDAKDVRNDRRAQTRTLYLKLMANGLSFRLAHRLILMISLAAFFVAPVYFGVRGAYLESAILTAWTALWTVLLFHRFPNARWFAFFLFFTLIYLLILVVVVLKNPSLLAQQIPLAEAC